MTLVWTKLLPLIQTLLWCCHISSAYLDCGQCTAGASLLCPNYSEEEQEFEVKVYDTHSESDTLDIKCVYKVPVNFTLLKGCHFDSVSIVKFHTCSFSNESISEMFDTIGVKTEKVTMLWRSIGSDANLQFRHLKGLTNLSYLFLDSLGFQNIDQDAFDATPKLENLYLKGNNLITLNPNTFKSLSNLIILNLSNNNLTSLPPKLFDSIPKLTKLYVLNNKIKTLPSHIFDNLPSLSEISFLTNEIEVVDNDLFIFNSNLSNANFRNNNLKDLPQGLFRNCSKLKVLQLKNNKIKNMASQLFSSLPLLTKLDISGNKLESLPSDLIERNRNLESFDLSNNIIEELPADLFKSGVNITTLRLTNNILVSLPDNLFSRCRSLKTLYINKNQLSTLSFNTFPSHPNSLSEIDLSHNNLTNNGIIHNYIFALNNQLNLDKLDLSYNQFDEFPYNASLYNFLKLKTLNLSYNHITQIHGNDILNLANLIEIDFRWNKINTFIVLKWFDDKRVNVFLEGNNLTCDCKLYELVNTIQQNTPELKRLRYSTSNSETQTAVVVNDQEKLVCEGPNFLSNQTLVDLNLSLLTCELTKEQCSEECPCSFRPVDRMVIVNCSNNRMTTPPNVVFNPTYDYTLDLSGNAISSFNFSNDPFVNINLSDNGLTAEDLHRTILSPNLAFLDISGNNLTSLHRGFLDQLNRTGAKIDARCNPWLCDCSLRDFQTYIQVHYDQILHLNDLKCDGVDGPPLGELTQDVLCPPHLQPRVLATVGVVAALLVIFAVAGTVLYYKYKTAIKVWLFTKRLCLWLVTEDELDVDKQYDAFISYSHKDEEFVNEVLLPGLEHGEPKYRVCLHYRDWVVGEYIQNQIMASVHSSRRTLVVLSANFIESVWGQMEFRAAHQQALQDKTNRVIVILYGEMPPSESLDDELRHYVSLHTYLKWGDPRFWESLRYAMPHPRHLLAKRRRKARSHPDRLELGVNGGYKDSTGAKG